MTRSGETPGRAFSVAPWTASAVAVALLAAAWAWAAGQNVNIEDLLRDPAAVTESPFYVGVFSNLGVMLWSAAAAVCLFRYLMLRSYAAAVRVHVHVHVQKRRFMLSLGLLTALAAMDDMFLFHEQLAPPLFGGREDLSLAAYLVVIVTLAVAFRREIVRGPRLPLAMAAACFLSSLLLDGIPWLVERRNPVLETVLEDGFKLLGIIWWLSYTVSLCLPDGSADSSAMVRE